MSATHEELTSLAAAYALGALDADERHLFEAHAAQCETCMADVEAFGEVTRALVYAVPQVSPRPGLRDRVLRAVGAGPAVAARPSRSLTGASTWLPIAALIAIAAGLGVYAAALRVRIADLEARLDQATARMLIADRALTDARRAAFQTQSVVDVLTAPDLARIDLAGQPAAPSARARALWSRQRGMVFSASNLPALPAGRTYQVWVVTANAKLSAGLITPDASGRSTAVFATPPDIEQPVAVAVTLEPAGGVPQPTGAFYLLGTPAL